MQALGAACRQQSPSAAAGGAGLCEPSPKACRALGQGPEAQPHLRLCPTARSFCGAQ